MNKKSEILTIILLFISLGLSFIFINIIKENSQQIMLNFSANVIPILFIMIFISQMLYDLNINYYLTKIFKNNYISIFIISLLSASPTNAILIKKALENHEIKENDASKLLICTTTCSPLFIYSYSQIILKKTKYIILLMIIYYIIQIILFLTIKKSLPINKNIKRKQINFKNIFLNNIEYTILTTLKIFGITIFFNIIISLLIPYNFNTIYSSIVKGFIEVTQGLISLNKLNISIIKRELTFLLILFFGSFSVHIQISSILSNYNINYKYFYISRIILIIIYLTLTV